jgi:hypothetical protein
MLNKGIHHKSEYDRDLRQGNKNAVSYEISMPNHVSKEVKVHQPDKQSDYQGGCNQNGKIAQARLIEFEFRPSKPSQQPHD